MAMKNTNLDNLRDSTETTANFVNLRSGIFFLVNLTLLIGVKNSNR